MVNPMAVAAIARNLFGLRGTHFVPTLNTAVFLAVLDVFSPIAVAVFDFRIRSDHRTVGDGAGSGSLVFSSLTPLFSDLGSSSTSCGSS